MKKSYIYTILILCSIAFLIISFLVFATDGKVAIFVKQKLKIGAIIISMTALLSACDGTGQGPVSCYVQSPSNFITIKNSEGNVVKIDRGQTLYIEGEIFDREGTEFSFVISKTDTYKDSEAVLKGNIDAADGSYDESTEEFKIAVNYTVIPGSYWLLIYDKNIDSVDESSYRIYLGKLIVEEDPVECYDVGPDQEYFTFENLNNGAIQVDLSVSKTLNGEVFNRMYNAYSYVLSSSNTDPEQNVYGTGNISAEDGSFDEVNEKFTISLENHTPPGVLYLYVYTSALDEIENKSIFAYKFKIKVTDNVVTCYEEPIDEEYITFKNLKDGKIVVNLQSGPKLLGELFFRNFVDYSYVINPIQDAHDQNHIEKGNITAADGSFDELNEEFVINLNENYEVGEYSLKIYSQKLETIKEFKYFNHNFVIQIIDGE